MRIDFDNDIPIYQQIADQIEAGILSGAFAEEEQVPSTTEISVMYRINPATVLKGMTQLADQGLLYKKRGIGMFVKEGAREVVLQKRREDFYQKYLSELLAEAERLGIDKEQLIEWIRRG